MGQSRRLPIAIGVGLAGWLFIDSALKGEAPFDRLATIFAGAEPKGRLADPQITPGTSGTPPTQSNTTGYGTLEMLGPWNEPKNHSGHLHWAHANPKVVEQIGLELISLGYTVGENPRFGGVAGSCQNDPHVIGSWHCRNNYAGHAVDINWNGWGEERMKLWEAAQYINKRVKEIALDGGKPPGGGQFPQ